jgi:D-alanyl-D-alanine endopeptidase (penicillin-binding protein 7)
MAMRRHLACGASCWALGLVGAIFAMVAAVPAALGGERPAVKEPQLRAHAVLALHSDSGTVLLSRNATEQRAIASLTKLVAALVVREKGLPLDGAMTLNRADYRVALGGARTRLELEWSYHNRDLLRAALMSSDNRAVSALGRAVNLDAEALVAAMNAYVRGMGLERTRFEGPVGLHHGNRSTAWELARIARRASKDPVLREVMSTPEYRVRPKRGYLSVHYRNTNPFVGNTKAGAFIASKTGYNAVAGYCIAAVIAMPRLGPVSIVLLGSKSKYGRVDDLRRVLRWLQRHGTKALAAARSEGPPQQESGVFSGLKRQVVSGR